MVHCFKGPTASTLLKATLQEDTSGFLVPQFKACKDDSNVHVAKEVVVLNIIAQIEVEKISPIDLVQSRGLLLYLK